MMTKHNAAQQRLLISFAHPDDETFGLGSAIAYYVEQGVQVDLICATNGEAGDVAPEYMRGFDSIAEVRLAELACAAEKLGINEIFSFGYRDSGMMGTVQNDHPDSLWQAPEDELVGRVVEVIRRVRPQVIVTFDPYGGYGHPDHIAIHRATLAAFHAAGDAARYPEQLAEGLSPFQPQKLYYSVFPRLMIRLAVTAMRLTGRDPRKMGRNNDLDLQAVLDATLPITTRVDLAQYYDIWMDASACHASQQGGGANVPLPRFIARQLFGRQTFFRAYPEVNGSGTGERDLFADVAVQPED